MQVNFEPSDVYGYCIEALRRFRDTDWDAETECNGPRRTRYDAVELMAAAKADLDQNAHILHYVVTIWSGTDSQGRTFAGLTLTPTRLVTVKFDEAAWRMKVAASAARDERREAWEAEKPYNPYDAFPGVTRQRDADQAAANRASTTDYMPRYGEAVPRRLG